MNVVPSIVACLPPPTAPALCVTFPGGARFCAPDPNGLGDPFQVVQAFFAHLTSGLAAFQPVFDIIGVVEAIANCLAAIPKSLSPPNPQPLLDCIPDLTKAIAKVVAILPPLSMPVMIIQFIKGLIAALAAFISRLEWLIQKGARLASASTNADKPGNAALKPIVACAAANHAVDLANLAAAVGPLNQLIGLVNALAAHVPGLPQPLIPLFEDFGPDPSGVIGPLAEVVDALNLLLSQIPV